MGRKNKHSHRAHPQPASKKQTYEGPPANKEELAIQCLELHELLSARSDVFKTLQTGDLCYLLSTKWLSDWKDYVGYHKVTGGEKDECSGKEKKIGRRNPGKINSDISGGGDKYYVIPEELQDYSYLNEHLAEKMEKESDFIAVTSHLWQAFLKRYEGICIRRPVRRTKHSVFYDSNLLTCEVVFVDPQREEVLEKIKKNHKNILSSDKMNLPTIWTLSELTLFLSRYCLVSFGNENIRLWKAYSYLATLPLCNDIIQSISDQSYTINGYPLKDKYDQLDIDTFLKETHVLILEIGSKFTQKQPVGDIVGFCEECVVKHTLDISCLCGEVHYCSHKCRIDDMSYHREYCPQAFESEDDEEFETRVVKEEPMAGLTNVGNTCYMNSAMQCFFSIPPFRQFFSGNAYLEHLDAKEVKENNAVFLRKLSKMIKKASLTDILTPWSLKGQIQFFLIPFKGNKQHDANDFLVNFLNTINDFLTKEQDFAYSPFFREHLLGKFHSTVTCPECNFQNITDQIFMQITIPIKSKAKQMTYNYAVVENAFKIIKGKAEVKETWIEMKKQVQVDQNCLVGLLKEPEGIVPLNETETTPDKIGKKSKGEICYYPNVRMNQDETLFVFSLISIKTICLNEMKSSYGCPEWIGVNTAIKTLGTFYLQIVRHFSQDPLIREEAQAIEHQYFQAIQEASIKQSGEKEENKEEQVVTAFNARLEAFSTKTKLTLFIFDFKRHKNVCRYCNRKCSNCILPLKMNIGFEDHFAGRYNQTRFEVYISDKYQGQNVQRDLTQSGDATLAECLQQFNVPEQLDEQNAWYCVSCDAMRLALKEIAIKQFPRVLIIHLNRFKSENGRKVKNGDPVVYEATETFGGQEYDLLGVIVHEGSMEGGHYWCICRRGSQFHIFNDSKVCVTDKIVNKNAYILLYIRRE